MVCRFSLFKTLLAAYSFKLFLRINHQIEKTMKKNPQLLPRYAGIPKFMRCPYQEDLSDLDIALIGIPFDGLITQDDKTYETISHGRGIEPVVRQIVDIISQAINF